jgi:hypothetical protein
MPCSVCGGYEGAERGNGSRCYGFFSTDGKYAHCAREEYAGDIELTESSGTYAHYLGGRCKCGVNVSKVVGLVCVLPRRRPW